MKTTDFEGNNDTLQEWMQTLSELQRNPSMKNSYSLSFHDICALFGDIIRYPIKHTAHVTTQTAG